MAALIGEVLSDDGRSTTHRVAHRNITGRVASWHTKAETYMLPDGSGRLEVWQNSELIHRYEWGSENAERPKARRVA